MHTKITVVFNKFITFFPEIETIALNFQTSGNILKFYFDHKEKNVRISFEIGPSFESKFV